MPDIIQMALERRARLQHELDRIEGFIRMANGLLADARQDGERGADGISGTVLARHRAQSAGDRRAGAGHEIAPGVIRITPHRRGPGMAGGGDHA